LGTPPKPEQIIPLTLTVTGMVVNPIASPCNGRGVGKNLPVQIIGRGVGKNLPVQWSTILTVNNNMIFLCMNCFFSLAQILALSSACLAPLYYCRDEILGKKKSRKN
jgi:hypothetical protein